MSWFETTEFDCPRCGERFHGATAETINATRMPAARDRIFDGSFNRVRCSRCGASMHVDRTFLYSDIRREQFVHVFPLREAHDWPRLETVAEQTFHDAFHPSPPAMQEASRRFAVRAVFGLRALADKLRLWDAGLDDALVELQKLELYTGEPALRRRGDALLDVVGVDREAGHVEVEARSASGAWEVERFGLSLARYRELEASRAELEERYPGLFLRPFVSVRRLAHETLA